MLLAMFQTRVEATTAKITVGVVLETNAESLIKSIEINNIIIIGKDIPGIFGPSELST